ncbi:nitrogen fixation protein NifQ [Vogesella sp. XCS3]|uniref:nitrogen fixation protein NifQ n=1 Tax=Vogesella sp. XCS3 TaxID=2877939 RepID=UPI001D09E308|nr:nitrogen fixation protein NifQ [Vogesella sp. XCS3]UDM16828.1 nitrogen fixation protein NifQ [Vogesella sp. XCS3]
MQRHIHSLSNYPVPEDRIAQLLRRSLAAVLRGAQDGNLPLFTWTLGLSQEQLLGMLAEIFPELASGLEPLPDTQYAHFLLTTPVDFTDLVNMLCTQRSVSTDSKLGEWLARVIAAASFGNRHLWQDMGLSGREEVDELLATCFLPLYQGNAANLKWKRFLFSELGKSKGLVALRPPGCQHCDHFLICFPN